MERRLEAFRAVLCKLRVGTNLTESMLSLGQSALRVCKVRLEPADRITSAIQEGNAFCGPWRRKRRRCELVPATVHAEWGEAGILLLARGAVFTLR